MPLESPQSCTTRDLLEHCKFHCHFHFRVVCTCISVMYCWCVRSVACRSVPRYVFLHLSADIFIRGYFYTYPQIFLSADIFICGYFYPRIFLSADIFIRGYFCNKIKNLKIECNISALKGRQHTQQ